MVVIGCGRVGSGAIQGARIAGAERIVAVDLVAEKRNKVLEDFVTSLEEATALVAETTRGVMADSAIITVGLVEGAMIGQALDAVRKGGAVVLTGIAAAADVTPRFPWRCSRCSRSACWEACTARRTRARTSPATAVVPRGQAAAR